MEPLSDLELELLKNESRYNDKLFNEAKKYAAEIHRLNAEREQHPYAQCDCDACVTTRGIKEQTLVLAERERCAKIVEEYPYSPITAQKRIRSGK
jgi:hypothetical protein